MSNLLDDQLAVSRRFLTKYRDTPATQAACELVRVLFDYRAETNIVTDRNVAAVLNYQRDAGATPEEALARCVAFLLFVDQRPGYFRGNQTAEDTALGRAVAHCVPVRKRFSSPVYSAIGRMVRHLLWPYALALLTKIKTEADRVARLRAASTQLETTT